MTPRALARLLLLGTVLVWGATFAIVKAALADASPLLFNLIRMFLASVVLVGLNWRSLARVTRRQAVAGCAAGAFLAVGYQFQTLGLTRTTAAKSAFITGLVVVLVPLLAMVPGLRTPGSRQARSSQALAIGGALVAFAGLAMLTTPPGTTFSNLADSIGLGDLLTLICALAFALHLLTLARVSTAMPAGLLATLQIGAAAILMFLTLPLEAVHRAHFSPRLIVALVVTSTLATAAAFTIQSYAQKHLQPVETAVLLTLEPVFAALTSVLFLGEHFTPRALCGAGLILGSIVMLELAPGLLHSQEIPS